MLYDINLKITYSYEVPASGGRHVVRVLPLSLPDRQRLIAGTVSFSPAPEERNDSIDFFANPATSITFRSAHAKLVIRMQARVQLDAPALTADFSPQLPDFPSEIANVWSAAPDSPHHFLGPSPLLPDDPSIASYTAGIVKPDMTIRQIAKAICERIHEDFTYDPKATTVDTSPKEA